MKRIALVVVVAMSIGSCTSDSQTESTSSPASVAATTTTTLTTTSTEPRPTTVLPGPLTPTPVIGHDGCAITAPPAQLNLDPFYAKHCDAGGIPIVSSAKVPDEALGRAWNILTNMLLSRPDLHQALVAGGQYFGVIAQSEVTTDIPEYRDLADDPITNWDERARGLGGFPFASGAEENLMCYPDDPYIGESIAVHEFAHTIDAGMDLIDTEFDEQLTTAYTAAMGVDLWGDTYAATNADEYWAEGVQSYFNTNIESSPPNGIHNEVNTRDELATYDPELFALIDATFGGFAWAPICDEL